VDAGAVLVELDDGRLKLELAAAKASHEAALATVAERDAAVGRERRQVELLQRAASEGGTNPREMSDAESDLAVAQAQAAQARAAAMVIEQQAALLARRLADLSVRAPFAGTVTRRHTDAGAWVAAGGAVVDLVDTALLEGWFDVPQELYEQAAGLASADGIEMRSPSGGAVRGSAVRVIPEIDLRARTFHAVLTVANEKGALAPGLALTAYVPQGAPRNWLMLPKDALVYQGVNTLVYVVRGGVALPVQVRVAFPVGDQVAVEAEQLTAGAQVVIEGNERLMPMAPVAPIAGAVGLPVQSGLERGFPVQVRRGLPVQDLLGLPVQVRAGDEA
jgi:RND family efflux transporter MFP subunit